MSITYPIDILSELPGWSSKFDLGWQKDVSRTRGGRYLVKDIGPALWTAAYTTREMRPNELDYWRARMDTLEGGARTFKGYHKARCYPIDDPNGSKLAGVTLSGIQISEIGTDNKSLKIDGLPVGYVLSVGDLLSHAVSSGLRYVSRVVDGGTAGSGGETGFIEVRPHLPTGTAVDQVVTIVKPWLPMSVVPGSINMDAGLNGRGRLTFEAIEAK